MHLLHHARSSSGRARVRAVAVGACVVLAATGCNPGWYTAVVGTGTSTFSGDGGPATSALVVPSGIAVAPDGSLLIADQGNNRLRRVDHSTGIITTIAGNGDAAVLDQPAGVAVDAAGDIYVSEAGSDRVRRIDHATGTIETITGDGSLQDPGDLALDAAGNLYVADGDRVLRIEHTTATISVATGGGTTAPATGVAATDASLGRVRGITVAADGDLYFLTDQPAPVFQTAFRVDHATNALVLVAGGGTSPLEPGGVVPVAEVDLGTGPADIAVTSTGTVLVGSDDSLLSIEPGGSEAHVRHVEADAAHTYHGTNSMPTPQLASLALTAEDALYVISHPWSVDRVDSSDPALVRVAGMHYNDRLDGQPGRNVASWRKVTAVAVDQRGDVYVSFFDVAGVYRVDHATNAMNLVAGTLVPGFNGDGGPATDAQLSGAVSAMAFDSAGNLYLADLLNSRVRRIDHVTGTITTVAGGPPCTAGTADPNDGDGGPATSATLCWVGSLAVGPAGDLILDDIYGGVRRVDLATGIITTVTGGGDLDPEDGPIPADQANLQAQAMAVDPSGNIYLSGAEYVFRIDAVDGIIQVVTADGPDPGDPRPDPQHRLRSARALAAGDDGKLYLGYDWAQVRRFDPSTGVVATIAATGTARALDGNLARRDIGSVWALAARGSDLYIGSNFIASLTCEGGYGGAACAQVLHVFDAAHAPTLPLP